MLFLGKPEDLAIASFIPSDVARMALQVEGGISVENDRIALSPFFTDVGSDAPFPSFLRIAALPTSVDEGVARLTMKFYDASNAEIAIRRFEFAIYHVSLDVDADRDGMVEYDHPNKKRWQWGAFGNGAILLVNNDQDIAPEISDADAAVQDVLAPSVDAADGSAGDIILRNAEDLKDMSQLRIRVNGRALPAKCMYRISVARENADCIRILRVIDQDGKGGVRLKVLTGPAHNYYRFQANDPDIMLYAEGLRYADADFDGRLYVNLDVEQSRVTVFHDAVLFKIAPWIKTNTLDTPLRLFVHRNPDEQPTAFLRLLQQRSAELGLDVDDIVDAEHAGDRWMRDQFAFGFSAKPDQTHAVVVNSARRRNEAAFNYPATLIGPNTGYHLVTSDPDPRFHVTYEFGNIIASPPVAINGIEYPFGRIFYGGAHPDRPQERKLYREMREFLHAQEAQAPVELYSSWASVGHVDEFIAFVPAPTTPKRFKLLIASPARFFTILEDLKRQGFGDTPLFTDKEFAKPPSGAQDNSAQKTVNELLIDERIHPYNLKMQRHVDYNERILRQALGLVNADIIKIPALYGADSNDKAFAYMPNLINMVVWDTLAFIPKPHGPIIGGGCCIERHVEHLLRPLGIDVRFVEDWDDYHIKRGNLHCATNIQRRPSRVNWWDLRPPAQSGGHLLSSWN